MNGSDSQRLSQTEEYRETKVGGILEQAEAVALGVLQSIQAIARTTSCKGVQIAKLKTWCIEHKYWINDINELGSFEDRGSENEVYMSHYGANIVIKLNDFRYSDDNLSPFFERLKAHNIYFPDCAYSLIGFAENTSGKTCAVITQPYIISEREATEEEISNELHRLGFIPQMNGEYYTNGIHDIFDASPNNVLVGIDGNLYFIDTIIYPSNEENITTYRSQSPKYSLH